MREFLSTVSEGAITAIDAVALLTIAFGTIQALAALVPRLLASGAELRTVWLRYTRWLIAALTFQLAAGIIETSIGSSWQAIARVGAIAVFAPPSNTSSTPM